MIYSANDKYRATIRSTWIASPADSTIQVTAIPTNVPTIVVLGWNTQYETSFYVTGTSGDNSSNYALTGVTKIKGYSGNIPENTAVNCLNVEEFFNQYATAIATLQEAMYIDGVSSNSMDGVLDEDNMASNSATKVPTQQSVKAYVDSQASDSILTTSQYAHQGFLINGKIVPSVASNNLTVAIKGIDGNDPSSSNPVYCRIGDTVYTISSALSVTRNAGANWFNAGSAELAAKEIDYFVYLFYYTNAATPKLDVGFSRIPYARSMADFNLVADNTEKSFLFNYDINTPTSTIPCENIGRFAATLSAGAGYNWSVPTFTASNLIQRPIYETRMLDWVPTLGAASPMTYGSTSTSLAKYQVRPFRCFVAARFSGTTGSSASSEITCTLPFACLSSDTEGFPAAMVDGGNTSAAYCFISSNTANIRRYDAANYGLGANRGCRFCFEYRI